MGGSARSCPARCEELQSTLIAAERRYGDSMRALQASHAGGWRSTQKRLVALEAEARRLKARDGMWSQLCEKQRLLVRAVRAGRGKLEAARLASEVAAWEAFLARTRHLLERLDASCLPRRLSRTAAARALAARALAARSAAARSAVRPAVDLAAAAAQAAAAASKWT